MIPKTMRAAVLYDVDDIRIEERAVPELGPRDLLVRTGASGVCSGDLMGWYVRRKAPFVFGHEPAGTVVAAGDECDDAEGLVGKAVFAHHHAPCMRCAFCVRGDYVQCTVWRSSSLDPGAMAEYFRVPEENRADLLTLPDGLGFVAGSLVEPLACVVKSLRRAGARFDGATPEQSLRGRTVYVVGLGVMGLMHVALVRALGAVTFGSDFLAPRRALAGELGATALEPEAALAALRQIAGGGADIVVCGPGSSAALQHSIDAASPGGTVSMFAPLDPQEPFPFDQSSAYFRDLRLVASYSCGPDDTRAALGLLASGVVRPDDLGIVTSAFPAVADAYSAMRRSEIVKAVVTFPP